MTFTYIPQLICLLTGLIGIHSQIVRVSEVSVQAGDSISIPCLYKPRYTDHVKYLCKGYYWSSCSSAVRTDQQSSGKFSISDDKSRRIFTVTINDLRSGDTHYWCAVEIKRWLDKKQYFHLSVTGDMPSLSVDQQNIVAFEGGSVNVICRYKNDKVTAWCGLGSTCVAETEQTGTIDGTTVIINQSVPNVFNVTMSDLKANSISWYICKSQKFQMPVRITVHELTSTTTSTMTTTTTTSTMTTTTTTTTTTTADFTETLPTTPQHSSMLTSAETNPTVNGTGGDSLQDEHKISTRARILITTLTLSLFLLLLVPAAFWGWRTIRSRHAKPEAAHIPAGSQTGSDPDVLYASVVHNQHVAAQNKIEPAEGRVIYSTLHIKMQ